MDPNEDTLSEAVNRSCLRPADLRHLIDPEGMLVPGIRQYNTIRDMLNQWIQEYGPEKALDEAEKSAKHLKTWWKIF